MYQLKLICAYLKEVDYDFFSLHEYPIDLKRTFFFLRKFAFVKISGASVENKSGGFVKNELKFNV